MDVLLVANLDPSWQSGLTLTGRVYTGSTIVASVAMLESPAGSARYVATYATPAAAAAYQWTVVDAAGRGVWSDKFWTDAAGADLTGVVPSTVLPPIDQAIDDASWEIQ